MVEKLIGHVGTRVGRLGLPTKKELISASRARSAAALRLSRASASWRRERQLELLERSRRTDELAFAVLGDAEPGRFWLFRKLFNAPGVFESQLRRIESIGVDFTMQLGDMVSRGIERNYLNFFRSLSGSGLKTPYLTTIGNHDRRFPHGRCDSTLYRNCFGRTNYFFDQAGVRFVSLDSSLLKLSRRQINWLDRVLNFDGRKIVFTHVPPAGLKEWTEFGGAKTGGFKTGASEFISAMSRRRVDRVYMGHIHAFGVQDFKGVRYVLSGGGGSPLYPVGKSDSYHHFLSVRVTAAGIRETMHLHSGRDIPIPSVPVLLSR